MLLICEDEPLRGLNVALGVSQNPWQTAGTASCCKKNSTLAISNVLAVARFGRPTDCYPLLEVSNNPRNAMIELTCHQ